MNFKNFTRYFKKSRFPYELSRISKNFPEISRISQEFPENSKKIQKKTGKYFSRLFTEGA